MTRSDNYIKCIKKLVYPILNAEPEGVANAFINLGRPCSEGGVDETEGAFADVQPQW